MPALSQMVLEAAGMLQEQGMAVDAAVVNAVGNWDWCTVAVFTCRDSCCGDSGGVVAAEEVLLVTEAECEQAPAAKGAGGGGGGAQQQEEGE